MVKKAENTSSDTSALSSWGYGIFEVSTLTVVISRKPVNWAENMISDTCALNSRRYEIFEVLPHTFVEGRQTFKCVQNTIYDTELIDIWDFLSFTSFSCNKP